ncbi:MAG: ribosomal protein S18-alanine N-acetyltransferase [Anaerolineae bacterium]
MSLNLRYMRAPDIVPVVEIDRVAFSTPWSARSYAYEISESSYSHMVVLEETAQHAAERGWRRELRRWFRNHKDAPPPMIVGYGGLWNIVDEAHISTIATHPEHRGKGYGELLLAAMVQRAINLEARYVVLEVRVSNLTAQNLYHKYDFVIVDTKRNYYRDDNEDAYDMRLDLENPDILQRFAERFVSVQKRLPFNDAYTSGERPRP